MTRAEGGLGLPLALPPCIRPPSFHRNPGALPAQLRGTRTQSWLIALLCPPNFGGDRGSGPFADAGGTGTGAGGGGGAVGGRSGDWNDVKTTSRRGWRDCEDGATARMARRRGCERDALTPALYGRRAPRGPGGAPWLTRGGLRGPAGPLPWMLNERRCLLHGSSGAVQGAGADCRHAAVV